MKMPRLLRRGAELSPRLLCAAIIGDAVILGGLLYWWLVG